MLPVILFVLVFGFFAWCGVYGYRSEKKDWNNGKCKKCGSPLEVCDTDSHGNRMYACSAGRWGIKCEGRYWYVWISYPCIDHLGPFARGGKSTQEGEKA
jgi:hypothetical protein